MRSLYYPKCSGRDQTRSKDGQANKRFQEAYSEEDNWSGWLSWLNPLNWFKGIGGWFSGISQAFLQTEKICLLLFAQVTNFCCKETHAAQQSEVITLSVVIRFFNIASILNQQNWKSASTVEDQSAKT